MFGNNFSLSFQFTCPPTTTVTKPFLKSFQNNTLKMESQPRSRWTRCRDRKDGFTTNTESKWFHGKPSLSLTIPKGIIVASGRTTQIRFSTTSWETLAWEVCRKKESPWELLRSLTLAITMDNWQRMEAVIKWTLIEYLSSTLLEISVMPTSWIHFSSRRQMESRSSSVHIHFTIVMSVSFSSMVSMQFWTSKLWRNKMQEASTKASWSSFTEITASQRSSTTQWMTVMKAWFTINYSKLLSSLTKWFKMSSSASLFTVPVELSVLQHW
jgi:hypothetical protein